VLFVELCTTNLIYCFVQVVATSKFACQQLDKLELAYPIIKTTPDEVVSSVGLYFIFGMMSPIDLIFSLCVQLIQGSKAYYERSYVKSGVDKAYSIVLYGENKVVHNLNFIDFSQALMLPVLTS